MTEIAITFDFRLLDELHSGTGVGRLGLLDDTQSRDQRGRPVVWASTLRGLLREAGEDWLGALRQAGVNVEQERSLLSRLLGRRGDERGLAIVRSMFLSNDPANRPAWFHIWAATAREIHSRRPDDSTLRFIEYARADLIMTGEIRVCDQQHAKFLCDLLKRLQSLGGGKTRGWGRVELVRPPQSTPLPGEQELDPAWEQRLTKMPADNPVRLRMLLRNLEPLNIAKTAYAGNLIFAQSFIPGTTLRGALLTWINDRNPTLATGLAEPDRLQVGNGYIVPGDLIEKWSSLQVIPLPLSIEEPKGGQGPGTSGSKDMSAQEAPNAPPWWATPSGSDKRLGSKQERDQIATLAQSKEEEGETFKRIKTEEYLVRTADEPHWRRLRPKMGVLLRNSVPTSRLDGKREVITDRPENDEQGTPVTSKEEGFFSEQVLWEDQTFLAEIRLDNPQTARDCLAAITDLFQASDKNARSWLRVGRKGRPVRIEEVEVGEVGKPVELSEDCLTLTLTSDLIARDDLLRFRTDLEPAALRELIIQADGEVPKATDGIDAVKRVIELEEIYGFNSATGLPRRPALAMKRGSVFHFTAKEDTDQAVLRQWRHTLRQLEASGTGLGERTAEGFGRFRVDLDLHTPTYWQQQRLPLVEKTIKRDEDEQQEVVVAAREAALTAADALLRRWSKNKDDHKDLTDPRSKDVPSVSQWQWLRNQAQVAAPGQPAEAEEEPESWAAIFRALRSHAGTLAGRRKWNAQLIDDLEKTAQGCGALEYRRFFIDQLVQAIVARIRRRRRQEDHRQ